MPLALLLWLTPFAAACSCGRPPFAVVGGPRALREEKLHVPKPESSAALVVPTLPVLTVTRMRRWPGDRPETVPGSARFVRLDTGEVIAAHTLRRRRAAGLGELYVQLDVRPAHPLVAGAAYALEFQSYPGSRAPGWFGVRLEVSANPDPLPALSPTVSWLHHQAYGVGDCDASGWTLLVGDPAAEPPVAARYDLFVQTRDGPWRFWGTFAGPLVGNLWNHCSNYAYGAEAPTDVDRVRIVPRDLTGATAAPVDVQLPPLPPLDALGESLPGLRPTR